MCQYGVAPDGSGLYDQSPILADGATHYGVIHGLGRRQGFAGQHSLVYMRAPLDYASVHWNAFTGAHHDALASAQSRYRHLLLDTVRIEPMRSLCLQTGQLANGR